MLIAITVGAKNRQVENSASRKPRMRHVVLKLKFKSYAIAIAIAGAGRKRSARACQSQSRASAGQSARRRAGVAKLLNVLQMLCFFCVLCVLCVVRCAPALYLVRAARPTARQRARRTAPAHTT
jgi:hypothetical protein